MQYVYCIDTFSSTIHTINIEFDGFSFKIGEAKKGKQIFLGKDEKKV